MTGSTLQPQNFPKRFADWLLGHPDQGFSSVAAVTCAGFWAWLASPFAIALSSLMTGEALNELDWMIQNRGNYLVAFYMASAAMAFLFCLFVVLPVIVVLKNVLACWRILPAWGIGWALAGGFWLVLTLATGGAFTREILWLVLAALFDSLPAAIAVSRYYHRASRSRLDHAVGTCPG